MLSEKRALSFALIDAPAYVPQIGSLMFAIKHNSVEEKIDIRAANTN